MSGHILIVEDDDSLSSLIGDYLSLSDFTFRVAKDGAEGLEAALEGTVDLVILDLMLPGMNGFEVLAGIRGKSEIPVLILSARREDIDKIRGLGLGADDYMTKPFSPGELIARVKAHLARHRKLTGKEGQGRNKVIKLRGLELDKDARQLRVLGREAELPPKEFEILLLLMDNPNRVFSKEELFSRVWGEDTYGDISTVTVHIRKIREKIEADPSDPKIIETVWGMGYRIRIG
jgi:two-component system, OmpR family, response regulator